ncbi:MAG TPA: cytochrome-c peroxidase, partial [Polyangia bacterium]|nr:cytochrome-c peroxidase [Polyangia bacterium]
MRTSSKLVAMVLAAGAVGVVRADAPKPDPLPKAGPLAQPAPTTQPGYPHDLYRATLPADNPESPDKVALGEKLFFDGRLSADGTVACATCHDPQKGFTDQHPTSIGIRGQRGQRNAPTVLNALFN